jgi:nucleotide-binding universal stress UspA family protein
MKPILALIDFSDTTDAVVKTAIEIAEAFKATLLLMHVSTPESDYEAGEMRSDVSREGIAGEMHRAHEELCRIEATCRTAGIEATAMLVRSHSARGNPIPKIIEEMVRVEPRLTVVGSHGYGRIHNLLLGSVSSEVVRKSREPVLVVPALRPT